MTIEATKYCEECETNQCDECLKKLHTPKRRKTHLENLSDVIQNDLTNNICKRHKNKEVIGYCLKCNVKFCSEDESSHVIFNHRTINIKEYDILINKYFTNVQNIENEMEFIKKKIINLMNEQNLLIENLNKDDKKINNYSKLLIDEIEVVEKETRKELEINYLEYSKILNDEIAQLNQEEEYMMKKIQKYKEIHEVFDNNFIQFYEELNKMDKKYENEFIEKKSKNDFTSNVVVNENVSNSIVKSLETSVVLTKIESEELSTEYSNMYVNVEYKKKNELDGLYSTLVDKSTSFNVMLKNLTNNFVNKMDKKLIKVIIYDRNNTIVKNITILNKNEYFVIKYIPKLIGEYKIHLYIKIDDEYTEIKNSPILSTSYGTMIKFNYSTDFDKNGIIYNLSTKMKKEKYFNLYERGLISISNSTQSTFSQNPQSIMELNGCNFYTQNEKNSYIIFDFKYSIIKPSHYTLKNCIIYY
jgi:hypothetical protein